MIIDVHAHIFTDEIMGNYTRGIYEQRRKILSEEEFKKFRLDGRAEALIEDMDKAGVDMAVCLAVDPGYRGGRERSFPMWQQNEYIAEAQAKYPDRIIGWFGIDPFRPDAVESLERGIKELGLKGVKLLPGWFSVSDAKIAPFMQKIEELGILTLIHLGVDPLPLEVRHNDPRDLDDLLIRHPKMKIIAAHFARGFDRLMGQMLYFRPGRLWADLSGWQFEHHFSPWYFQTQMRYFLDRFPDSILFGTDWPMIQSPFPGMKEWVEVIQNLHLPQACLDMGMRQFTQEEKDKILGGNAAALLGLAGG